MPSLHLKNVLTDDEKKAVWDKYGIPGTNVIRGGERQSVDGATDRAHEVQWQCIHALAIDLMKEFGIEFVESDVDGSRYGENGSLPK